MKKCNLAGILALAIFTACNQSSNNTTAVQSPIDTTAFQLPARPTSLTQYKTFIASLDTADVNSANLAAQKYQQLFQQEEATARDSGYILFSHYFETLDRNLNDLHEADTADYHAFVPGYPSTKDNTPTNRQKQYVETLHKNGFQLASVEGMTYVKPDYDVITSWFDPYVSPTMKEYLAQLNKENKEGFAADAGIVISPTQLVDRIAWWESFIKRHPSFVLRNEAEEQRKYLFTVLMLGMENTPVRSYQNGALEPFYKTAYDYLQKTYPESEANQLVAPYYKALQQRDRKSADALVKEYKSKGYIMSFGDR